MFLKMYITIHGYVILQHVFFHSIVYYVFLFLRLWLPFIHLIYKHYLTILFPLSDCQTLPIHSVIVGYIFSQSFCYYNK